MSNPTHVGMIAKPRNGGKTHIMHRMHYGLKHQTFTTLCKYAWSMERHLNQLLWPVIIGKGTDDDVSCQRCLDLYLQRSESQRVVYPTVEPQLIERVN